MGALSGGCGHGWLWGWNGTSKNEGSSRRRRRSSKPSESVESTGRAARRFPLKQAATAGSLALAGDTIAQVMERLRRKREGAARHSSSGSDMDIIRVPFSDHDWFRALRMASYGFLLYGPGCYVWYQYLDQTLPKPTVENLMLKVLLNQIVLGPAVIGIVFAWNNLWQGKFSELPKKYQKDALPTLLYGFRFWIPVSVLNFWVVPLQSRVAFMSMGSIFWNFCLSSSMSK
ncbi:protein Mpv17 isoform X2 [Rhodamnia argentea]|uniref:Protein Mpv17 isoform X2 n=1 Tax=Rhodamnia argentea TaxID=178133 RepID=A0ABM3HNC6_9MYRT|nr:protein Mpv17 isoform X2 [Rhodamnia argentea]